jgi:hypothetical protein
MSDLAPLQRSIIWAALAIIVLAAVCVAVIRILRTVDDLNPVIVGGIVLVKAGEALGGAPLYTYIGDVRSRSGVVGIGLAGSSRPRIFRVLVTQR